MPTTWAGMRRAVHDYEQDPSWYRLTPAGRRCSEALINQFNHRWLPRPLHPLGRAVLLSLHHDHVLAAIGQRTPPALVVTAVRATVRLALRRRLRAARR
ncbi:hypothetical protein [Streptomyces sp. NPDC085466]|uniref:hypothetical protein n=1 Tax=Streptomyces sp. NPDC085466 TaxID=3365725 RepID=UPI0037D0851D